MKRLIFSFAFILLSVTMFSQVSTEIIYFDRFDLAFRDRKIECKGVYFEKTSNSNRTNAVIYIIRIEDDRFTQRINIFDEERIN